MPCQTPGELALAWFAPSAQSVVCSWALEAPVRATEAGFGAYAIALGLTLALEAPFYFRFLPSLRWPRARIQAWLLANALTHPIVYWILPWVGAALGQSYRAYLTGAEGFAIAVEALTLIFAFRVHPGRSATVAAAANLASWWIGALLG